MSRDVKFESKNGFLGLGERVVLKLVKIIGLRSVDANKIKSIFGIGKELYLLKSGPLFFWARTFDVKDLSQENKSFFKILLTLWESSEKERNLDIIFNSKITLQPLIGCCFFLNPISVKGITAVLLYLSLCEDVCLSFCTRGFIGAVQELLRKSSSVEVQLWIIRLLRLLLCYEDFNVYVYKKGDTATNNSFVQYIQNFGLTAENELLKREISRFVKEALRANALDGQWLIVPPKVVEKMRKDEIWKITPEDVRTLSVLAGLSSSKDDGKQKQGKGEEKTKKTEEDVKRKKEEAEAQIEKQRIEKEREVEREKQRIEKEREKQRLEKEKELEKEKRIAAEKAKEKRDTKNNPAKSLLMLTAGWANILAGAEKKEKEKEKEVEAEGERQRLEAKRESQRIEEEKEKERQREIAVVEKQRAEREKEEEERERKKKAEAEKEKKQRAEREKDGKDNELKLLSDAWGAILRRK